MDNFIWNIISIHLRGSIYSNMLKKGFWVDSKENLYTMLIDTKLNYHINKVLEKYYCDYIVDSFDIEQVYQEVIEDMKTKHIFSCYFQLLEYTIYSYDLNTFKLALLEYFRTKCKKNITFKDIEKNIKEF